MGHAMTLMTRDLYAIPNGDRWQLAREGERIFIVHTPNLASGGRKSEIEIAAFLGSGLGPEQQALLRLIGTLAQE